MKQSQAAKLLMYLQSGKSITSLEAIQELGIMELPRRICDLIEDGWQINKEPVTVLNRDGDKCYVKRYSLKKEIREQAEMVL